MPEHLTNPPIAPENDSAFTNLLNTRRAGEEAIKLVKATAAGQRMNFHFFSFLPSAQEIESVRTHSREKTAEFVSQQLKWITVWNHATHFRELSRPEISAGGAYNLGIAHPNLRLSDQDLFRQDDQFLEKIREASLTLNKYAYILLTTFFGNDFSLIGQHLHDGEAALAFWEQCVARRYQEDRTHLPEENGAVIIKFQNGDPDIADTLAAIRYLEINTGTFRPLVHSHYDQGTRVLTVTFASKDIPAKNAALLGD